VVEVLLILDGASEPLGAAETSLERARTPALDRLASEGRLSRVRTVPPGLAAGSEAAIPALLGWRAPAAVDRGALEAAARGLRPGAERRAWRVDVVDGGGERVAPTMAARAAAALRERLDRHEVRRLSGHRLLVLGPPPLPAAASGPGLRPWPEGVVPPRRLDAATVAVAAAGAAAGAARLLGARVVVPVGATGGTNTDLRAKARAAVRAVAAGADRVVVHVGAPDEAAHEHDRAAKVAVLERVDRELVPALARSVGEAGGALRVCPDHGCDPASGAHDPSPVPCVEWRPGERGRRAPSRLTERAVAALPAVNAWEGAAG
jgi:2,3-bisphosphoglycerate-independent phosphoglycerate mutase